MSVRSFLRVALRLISTIFILAATPAVSLIAQAPQPGTPAASPKSPPTKLPSVPSAEDLLDTFEISVDYAPGKLTYHTGTSFMVSVGGIPYLVSAKHLFSGLPNNTAVPLSIRTSKSWVVVHATVHYPENEQVDLAVLTIDDPHPTEGNGLSFCRGSSSLGDEALFFGYPYGLVTDPNLGSASVPGDYAGRIVPFVKRATFSGVLFTGPHPNDNILVFDGINNEGFSGGPLIISDSSGESCVAGVVVGYRYVKLQVYGQDERETAESVRENTGLIYAVPGRYAVEIIKILASKSSEHR